MTHGNLDAKTLAGFGDQWSRFDQSALTRDHFQYFQSYFHVFPWDELPANATGLDLGCGSGRWARLVAPRVGILHRIDPSEAALNVARRNLKERHNCECHLAAVNEIPMPDDSMDFGYAIGVLHRSPDTMAGLHACVRKLKPGAPFLAYLYCAFDNRPRWFRSVWRLSNPLRNLICRMPFPLRYAMSQALAVGIYYPLARLSRILERFGSSVENVPLSDYRNKTFCTMRTNALDRFDARIERGFTAGEIRRMRKGTGLQYMKIQPNGPVLDSRRP